VLSSNILVKGKAPVPYQTMDVNNVEDKVNEYIKDYCNLLMPL
jgi:hypothetical protein